MSQKSSIFLFDRREVLTLGLATVVALFFAFTLGVHYGKRFGPKGPHGIDPVEATAVPASTDKIPSRLDFSEQGRLAGTAADEELSRTLEAAVKRSGLRLDTPIPITLPEETRNGEAGATRLRNSEKALAKKAAASKAGGFVLQIGSFPTEAEAREQLQRVGTEGVSGATRAVEVGGKGTWHRVILGPFPNRDEAKSVGARLKSKRLVESFLIAPSG